MTPTEKHREAGRKLWEICLNDGTPDAGELIAIALADFEREGMKRAAEIAREHIYSASQWGRVDDELKGGNRRAEEMAAAIFSEAGESE
ncbi:MAG: hypothetical protein M9945_12500 [Aquamicrobium sp.]|uniref:hypothetical protein n=1 Tax=Aquamicrobium sp. TaxID=1872579 RepID=UPI00349E7B41|nr:hypothetical protein [Aquamicrobium sp.]